MSLTLNVSRGRSRTPGAVDSGLLSNFSPLAVPAIQAWYDSNVGVFKDAGITPAVENDPVQQHNDQSGNGNHRTQATLAKRPLYKKNIQNGRPIIRYDGVNDFLEKVWGAPIAQPNTFFIVLNQFVTPGCVYDGTTGCANRNQFGGGMQAGVVLGGPTLVVPSGFILFTCIFNGGASFMYLNGYQVASGNVGAQTSGAYRTGTNCNETTPMQMDEAESIIYNAAVSNANRLSVEAYLKQKWGTP